MNSEPTKRPASKDGRTHSAKARVTPTEPVKAVLDKKQVMKEARERATSAKAIRDKHLGSTKLFPRPPSRGSKQRFTTSYTQNFEGAYVPPADLRPTSPTRRNNPHPSKQFMVWRVPTREIGVPTDEGLVLPPDFVPEGSEFDPVDDLGGSLDRLRMPPTLPTSTEYGAYLRRQKRQYKPPGHEEIMRPRVTKPLGHDVLERTMRDSNQWQLEEWLKTASPEEQHTILKMLKSAEEAQVKETIGQVMHPGAAKAVENWLQSADDKEREVAVRLFSSLGPRPSSRRHRSNSVPGIKFSPLSRQPLPAPPPMEQMRRSAYEESPVGQKLRTRRLSAPPGGPKPRPWPAGLWHHLPVRDPPAQVYHRGALFGAVRGGASHYSVHPEWPDYYGASFNSDVVH